MGIGHDTHRLVAGRHLILGGVKIDHPLGLAGHSDADVVLHAVADALLGAAALGDIGDHFPDTEAANKDLDSRTIVASVLSQVTTAGWRPVNLDLIIFAEKPKLGSHKQTLRTTLAGLLGLPPEAVNVKAKTGETVGPIGRGEAISAEAIVLLESVIPDS